MSKLTNDGILFAQRTHMNKSRAAVSHTVSGLFTKFRISNESFCCGGRRSGDMTGVDCEGAIKSSGLGQFCVFDWQFSDCVGDREGGVLEPEVFSSGCGWAKPWNGTWRLSAAACCKDTGGMKRWNRPGDARYTLDNISFDSFIRMAIWRRIVELRGPRSCWTAI